ncbi:DUF6953 family protein [Aromatoleum buckelii]
MTTTPDDVAEWMLSELQRMKYLYQETVVWAPRITRGFQ